MTDEAMVELAIVIALMLSSIAVACGRAGRCGRAEGASRRTLSPRRLILKAWTSLFLALSGAHCS
jgi:hypothetical protein